MEQLFNRISRIAKSYLKEDDDAITYDNLMESEDDELKRLIDELEQNGAKENGSAAEKDRISDPYLILGIAPSSSEAEIRNAYKQKIKEYHPDRVENLGEDIKKLAAEKTYSINAAYDMIKKLRGF